MLAKKVVGCRVGPCPTRFIVFWSFALYLFGSAVFAIGSYDEGDGSPEFPYQIAEPNQLIYMSQHPEHWDKHFILTADTIAFDG